MSFTIGWIALEGNGIGKQCNPHGSGKETDQADLCPEIDRHD
jgi:hypothetical protein